MYMCVCGIRELRAFNLFFFFTHYLLALIRSQFLFLSFRFVCAGFWCVCVCAWICTKMCVSTLAFFPHSFEMHAAQSTYLYMTILWYGVCSTLIDRMADRVLFSINLMLLVLFF